MSNASDDNNELTATPAPVCTRICTENQKSTHGEPPEGSRLESLATELAKLSPDERQRLAELLLRDTTKGI
ncbi:MAG: hypothetical protein VB835_07990 [Pirellulales bacterium]